MTEAPHSAHPADSEAESLRAELRALQNQKVEEWVRLIRYGGTVPLAIERSLSWRITRPLRLMQTAVTVLRRDGLNRFLATVNYRLKRLVRAR